jgi:pilus assembly protein Flp/PilA
MKDIKQLFKNLTVQDLGQDLIEYALVAALIGLGAVTAMKSLSTTIPAHKTVSTLTTGSR